MYRLGIVGLFFHVGTLLNAPQSDARWRLVGLAEQPLPDDDVRRNTLCDAAAVARERGVPLYSSVSELLDREDPDVVGVCNVHAEKHQVICEALRRNKHVIVDKPMVTRLPDFMEVISHLPRSNGTLTLMLDYPLFPVIQKARDIVLSGILGRILAVQSRLAFVQKVTARPTWFYQKLFAGGIINENGVHDIDLVQFITGSAFLEVTAVSGNGRIRQFPTAEDYAQAFFRLESDAAYSLLVDRLAPRWELGNFNAMRIWGAHGELELTTAYRQLVIRMEAKGGEEVFREFDSPKPLMREYADALDEQREPVFSGARALESTRIALLAQSAADERRTVPLREGR